MAEIVEWDGEDSEYILLRFEVVVEDFYGPGVHQVNHRFATSEEKGTREKNGKVHQLYEWHWTTDINEAHQFPRAQDAKWRPKIVEVFKQLVRDGWSPQVVRVKETIKITTETTIIDPVEDAIDGLAEVARKLSG